MLLVKLGILYSLGTLGQLILEMMRLLVVLIIQIMMPGLRELLEMPLPV
jgi:hypothetical protein